MSRCGLKKTSFLQHCVNCNHCVKQSDKNSLERKCVLNPSKDFRAWRGSEKDISKFQKF